MKPICQLHSHDKHREKIAAKGAQALKNEELMALLLDHVILTKEGYYSFSDEGML